MPRLKVGRTAACGAVLVLGLGAGVFALRDAPDKESIDETPVEAGAVPTLEGVVEPDPPMPVSALVPDTSVEDTIDVGLPFSESDDSQWNDGVVKDTGPFIDADDDAGDYSFSPVSDVGEFLDPDAG